MLVNKSTLALEVIEACGCGGGHDEAAALGQLGHGIDPLNPRVRVSSILILELINTTRCGHRERVAIYLQICISDNKMHTRSESQDR